VLWIRNDLVLGSYFGKVLVPVLVPVSDPDLFSTVFPKIWTKSCLFNASAALFPRKLDFWFLTFELHFMLDPDPNPILESETERISVPVPLRQKAAVPSVPASVPQHLRSLHLLVQWGVVLYAGVLEPVPLWGPVGRDPGVFVQWRAVMYAGVLEPVPLWGPVGRDPGVRGRQHQGAQAPPLHLLRLLPGKFSLEILINIHVLFNGLASSARLSI
jgi:hypothetical protein